MGDRDDDFFFGDQIFQIDFRLFFDDLRPPLILIGFADFRKLVLDPPLGVLSLGPVTLPVDRLLLPADERSPL